MIAANFCSRIIQGVAIQQKDANKYAYKVNQKMAIALCKEYLRKPDADGEELMRKIAKYTVPIRPDRADERKLQVKSFPGFVYRVAA